MTDIASRPSSKRISLPALRTVHKVCALIALAWLSVLGLTGLILDHHEWRWSHQWTVPQSWSSAGINRLVRGTIMREFEADANDPSLFLGASERGMWRTTDAGKTWTDVAWTESDGTALPTSPQVYDFVSGPSGDLNHVWVATDDGIWVVQDRGTRAVPFALRGDQITSLTTGSSTNQLLGVIEESRIFCIQLKSDLSADSITFTNVNDVTVTGLPTHIDLGRFMFELHLGRGFLPQPWSIIVNDYAGLSIAILSVTGLLFWWLPRRWRDKKPQAGVKARQNILRWLYRAHGPTIGLLGAIPILYVSVTGIALDHVTPFLRATKDILLNRNSLPPIYAFEDLTGEISSIVGFSGEPERLLAATRFGAISSVNGGRTWAVDETLPRSTDGTDAGRTNVFRDGDYVFVGIGGVGQFSKHDAAATWTEIPLDGPKLAITDASRRGDVWYLKNSRAIYTGKLNSEEPLVASDQGNPKVFIDSKIEFPPLTGTTLFLFIAGVHTGGVIHSQWEWVNDFVAVLAIILVFSGPVLWWRRKWM